MAATEKRTLKPMMACGHRANGEELTDDGPIACCVICAHRDRTDYRTVAENPPDLSERKARCGSCRTLASSENPALAFFSYRPDHEFDSFYCGCRGWD